MPRRPASLNDRPGGHDAQTDGASTRERILDIALDLFIEQGYDKTSLRQIAEQLGFTQAAIYYHFAAKEDILVALHLRLHEFGLPAFDRLEQGVGPSAWTEVLQELVDTMLANRKLFVLHERNQTAFLNLHEKGHQGANEHEDLEQRFRRILTNPAIPIRARVRMSCALGAIMTSVMFFSSLGDKSDKSDKSDMADRSDFGGLSEKSLGGLLCEVVADLLE